jgi:enoyl-CoA hydratase
MFFTGRAVSAQEAAQWGLVAGVHDDVVAHAVEVARTIAAADALSIELTKAALAHPHRSFGEGLDWEGFAQSVTMKQQRSSAGPVLRRDVFPPARTHDSGQ